MLLIGFVSIAAGSESSNQPVLEFDMPAQPLSAALRQTAAEFDLTIAFYSDATEGLNAPLLRGVFTSSEAFAALLSDTSLEFTYVNETSVAIRHRATISAISTRERGQDTMNETSTETTTKQAKSKSFFARIAAAVTALALSGGAAYGAQIEEADEEIIEEIVVTALKRDGQSLLNAAAGISVITSAQIEGIGATSLKDFLQLAPGTSISPNTLSGGNTIQIRGINAQVGSATVGFYLDDQPFSAITANILPDPYPFDLDRIEVLRGPQGSLYGGGSSGGVVILRTTDPVMNRFEGKLMIDGSSIDDGGESYKGSFAVNVPLIDDKLAMRLSGSYLDRDGWIDDYLIGCQPLILPSGFNPTACLISAPPLDTYLAGNKRSNINGNEQKDFRIKLKAQPTEKLTIGLLGNFHRLDGDHGPQSDASWIYLAGRDVPISNEFDQYGLTIEYTLPFATLRNSTGYIDYDQDEFTAANGTDINTILLVEVFTNELRLNSTGEGMFSWVGGIFYRDAEQRSSQTLTHFGFPFDSDEFYESEQVSVYGEGTWSLNDGYLDLTLGGSYFVDEVDNKGLTATGFRTHDQDTDLFSAKVNVAIHPTDQSTLYFNYAEGFRSGIVDSAFSNASAEAILGYPISAEVKPETSESFEIGFKGQFADGRLYAELVVFYITLEDTQQTATVPNPSGGLSATALTNAGDAISQGFEWLFRYTPTDGLTLVLSGAYIDATFDGDYIPPGSPPGATPIYEDGEPLNLVPEWIVNGIASYTHNIGSLTGTAFLSVQYADVRSLVAVAQPAVPAEQTTRVDARYELGRDQWSVFAYANNLTDEDHAHTPSTAQTAFPPFLLDGRMAARLQPRTLGLGVTYAF